MREEEPPVLAREGSSEDWRLVMAKAAVNRSTSGASQTPWRQDQIQPRHASAMGNEGSGRRSGLPSISALEGAVGDGSITFRRAKRVSAPAGQMFPPDSATRISWLHSASRAV
jgi:hypothetical protein